MTETNQNPHTANAAFWRDQYRTERDEHRQLRQQHRRLKRDVGTTYAKLAATLSTLQTLHCTVESDVSMDALQCAQKRLKEATDAIEPHVDIGEIDE